MRNNLHNWILPAAIIALILGIGAIEPKMFSVANLENMSRQFSLFFLVACAQLVVIITRGFDLSVGGNISTVSVASSMVMVALVDSLGVELAVVVGILSGLLIGVVIGAINGFFVAYVGVNAFVVTLAAMGILTGVAKTISDGFPIFNVPTEFTYVLNQATVFLLPVPFVIAGALAVAVHLLLSKTVHGRALFIIGDNDRAGHVAGIRVKGHRFFAFVTSGFLAALAGILMTAQVGSGEPNLGAAVMLYSIAAAVIGGASLRGGTGTVWAPIAGSMIIVVISVGMNLLRIDNALQTVAVGIVLILGTFADSLRNSRN